MVLVGENTKIQNCLQRTSQEGKSEIIFFKLLGARIKTFWNRPFSNIGQCKKLVWSCFWKCRWSRSFSLLSRTRVYTREHICTIVPAWNIHRHFYFNEDLWIIVVLPSVVTSFYRIWSNSLRKLDRLSWAENSGVEVKGIAGIQKVWPYSIKARKKFSLSRKSRNKH